MLGRCVCTAKRDPVHRKSLMLEVLGAIVSRPPLAIRCNNITALHLHQAFRRRRNNLRPGGDERGRCSRLRSRLRQTLRYISTWRRRRKPFAI